MQYTLTFQHYKWTWSVLYGLQHRVKVLQLKMSGSSLNIQNQNCDKKEKSGYWQLYCFQGRIQTLWKGGCQPKFLRKRGCARTLFAIFCQCYAWKMTNFPKKGEITPTTPIWFLQPNIFYQRQLLWNWKILAISNDSTMSNQLWPCR